MAILAHSHAGHTPGLSAPPGCHQLLLQIQSAMEAFDGIKAEYGPDIPVIVIGHSIGSWVTLQVRCFDPAICLWYLNYRFLDTESQVDRNLWDIPALSNDN